MLKSRFERPWEPVAWLVVAIWAWVLAWLNLGEVPTDVPHGLGVRQGTFGFCFAMAAVVTVWYPTAIMNTLTGGRQGG